VRRLGAWRVGDGRGERGRSRECDARSDPHRVPVRWRAHAVKQVPGARMNAPILLLLLAIAPTDPPAQPPAAPPSTRPEKPAASPAAPAETEPRTEPAAGTAAGPATAPEKRWSSFLPLMGEEARKRGVVLPLPFGVSLVYYHLQRDIEITDVRIGANGNPPRSVSQVARFSSGSKVDNVNLKIDAWILPFLNVYGLIGWFHNDSTTHVDVSIPNPNPIGPPAFERNVSVPTTIDGSVGGVGLTLAGGIPPFFLVVDGNVFGSDLGFSEKLRGSIAAARAGYAGELRKMPVNLWLSATYWNTHTTVKDEISDPDLGTLTFEADQGPRYPWTYGVGGQIRIIPYFEIFTEAGADFHGGWYFVVGPTGRT
jgi:hypothetical protein